MFGTLRRLFSPPLDTLSARITALEHAEQERERAVTEQLEQMRKYWKRIRTREAREEEDDDTPGDVIDRTILQMKLRAMKGNG